MPFRIVLKYVTWCHSGYQSRAEEQDFIYRSRLKSNKDQDNSVLADVKCTAWSHYKVIMVMDDTLVSSVTDSNSCNSMVKTGIAIVYGGLLLHLATLADGIK